MDQTVTVKCPTCAGQIRVKDASLLGQIVHCPRCKGLVLLQIDADQDAEQLRVAVNDPVDSQVETRDAIQAELPPIPNPAVDAAAGPAVPPPITPPNAVWESAHTKRSRQILLVGVLGGAGLLAACIVFYLFVRSYTNGTTVAAANAGQNAPAGQNAVGPAANDPADADPTVTEPEVPANAENPGPQQTPQQEQPPAQQSELPTEPALNPSANPATQIRRPVPCHWSRQPRTQPPRRTSLTRPIPTSHRTRPHRSHPARNPNKRFTRSRSSGAKDDEAPVLDLPPELKQFIPMLGSVPTAPDAQLPVPPTAEELRVQLNLPPAPDSRLHPPPAKTVEVAPRLARKINGIQTNADSLVDIMDSLSQLTGVPIWFDLATLDIAGVDLQKPIALSILTPTPLADVINQAAAAANCECVEEPPGFLCVRAPLENLGKRLAPAFDIADFGDDDEFAAQVAEQLSWIPGQPDTGDAAFKFDPQTKTLLPDAKLPIQRTWYAALSLDALRLARQLPPKLPPASTGRWLFRGAPPAPQPPADAAVQGSFDFAVPLARWARRLANTQHALPVVEWPAVWQHGLTSSKELLPNLQGATQAHVFNQLLKPYDLRVYQDGPQQIWIGPADAFESRVAVCAIQLPPHLVQNPKLVTDAIGKALQIDTDSLPAMIDPKSGNLILRQTRQLTSQIVESLAKATAAQ